MIKLERCQSCNGTGFKNPGACWPCSGLGYRHVEVESPPPPPPPPTVWELLMADE